MADLTRTKYGRKPHQKINTSGLITLTPYYKVCYKNPFSPAVPETQDLVQKTMGYHSQVSANQKS